MDNVENSINSQVNNPTVLIPDQTNTPEININPIKNNKSKAVIFVLSIIIIALSLSIVFLVNNNKSKEIVVKEIQETNELNNKISSAVKNEYKVENYVQIEKIILENNNDYIVNKINFSNLTEGLTFEFNEKQFSFISPPALDLKWSFRSNDLSYEIYNNILSVFSNESIYDKERKLENGNMLKAESAYSLNIDLDLNKVINNDELLKEFNISTEEAYIKILTNLPENVNTNSFLLSATGDIMADYIKIEEFKNKIPQFAKQINNRNDSFVLYIKNKSLYCAFYQEKILNLLGMGSHMGVGLKQDTQIVKLSL